MSHTHQLVISIASMERFLLFISLFRSWVFGEWDYDGGQGTFLHSCWDWTLARHSTSTKKTFLLFLDRLISSVRRPHLEDEFLRFFLSNPVSNRKTYAGFTQWKNVTLCRMPMLHSSTMLDDRCQAAKSSADESYSSAQSNKLITTTAKVDAEHKSKWALNVHNNKPNWNFAMNLRACKHRSPWQIVFVRATKNNWSVVLSCGSWWSCAAESTDTVQTYLTEAQHL